MFAAALTEVSIFKRQKPYIAMFCGKHEVEGIVVRYTESHEKSWREARPGSRVPTQETAVKKGRRRKDACLERQGASRVGRCRTCNTTSEGGE